MTGKPLHRTDMLDILLRKRVPIRFQFVIFLVLFTLFLISTVLWFNLRSERELLTRERRHIGSLLCANLADGCKEALLVEGGELYAIDLVAGILKHNRDIRYALVTDNLGRVVVHSDTSRNWMDSVLTDSVSAAAGRYSQPAMQRINAGSETLLDFSQPIIENMGRKRIGTARLALSEASIDRAVEQAAKRAAQVSLAVLLAGIIAAVLWARAVTRPVAELARGAEIIGTGDLSHRFAIRSRNELGELADILNRMTADLEEAQHRLISQRQLEHEIQLARTIQATRLPDRIPPSDKIDIAAFYRAAREVGGDYYDFIRVDERRLGILIADVSGKSLSGAFMMGITRAIVRSLAPGDLSPRNVLCRVNDVLKQNLKKGMFVTMLYAIFDLDTLELKIASAGHDPLFIKRTDESGYRLLNPRGCALGVSRDRFGEKLDEETLQLKPGDFLALTTDGVNEAMNPEGALYGDERLFEFLVKNSPQNVNFTLQALVAEIDAFYRGAEQSDDITMVMLKIL